MSFAVLLALRVVAQPAAPDSLHFLALSAGGTHTCALATGGILYCWGGNRWGQLGNGESEALPTGAPFEGIEAYDTAGALRVRVPQRVAVPARVAAISAGNQHSCALTTEGEMYCWGFGRFGQLGNGSFSDSPRPVRVTTPKRFRAISAGATHTCAIATDDTLFCWGGNWHGQVGDSSLRNRATPVSVASPKRFAAVAAGGIHSCAIDTAGAAWCWGSRSLGRLGLDPAPPQDQVFPARLPVAPRFRAIAAWIATCAVSAADEVYCWGLGGEAGGFRRIPLDARAAQLGVGSQAACIVAESTDLMCWESGISVTGTQDRVSLPPIARRLRRGVSAFSVGGNDFLNHTCTLGPRNAVRCWGNDAWAQLGPWASPLPPP